LSRDQIEIVRGQHRSVPPDEGASQIFG
jgi:hypothetical protein